MRRIDAQSDLQDGIDPAPLPPIAPDGAPEIPELRPQVPPCPSLCQAGPCRHYHTFVTQADAANPMASVVPIRLPEGTPGARPVPGGTLYQAPAVYHEEQHHYCYPTSGVEMNLGAVPVLKCNRWEPLGTSRYLTGHDIKCAYDREVKHWKFCRSSEAEQDAKVQELVASASPPRRERTTELDEHIAALLDRYHFMAAYDPERGTFVARCSEMPDIPCEAPSRSDAIDRARACASQELYELARNGQPFPTPIASKETP